MERTAPPPNGLARPGGFEPPTPGFEAQCSIRLSYERTAALCGAPTILGQAGGGGKRLTHGRILGKMERHKLGNARTQP